jgi:hypothetical protein
MGTVPKKCKWGTVTFTRRRVRLIAAAGESDCPYSRSTLGSARGFASSSLIAQTIASARSGLAPGPR